MAQAPFFLITGYLGAGKTTLMRNILLRHADCRRLAVVQNEFAPSGMDALELKRTGKPYRVLELNRGSIFCICLMSDFCRSLAALVDDYKPEAVFVEATGLADPIAVAQLLEAPELRERVFLRRIWCLVDLASYAKYGRSIRQVVHQIRVADTVLLNKTDLAPAGECDRVAAEIRALNPFATVVPAAFAQVELGDVFDPPDGAPAAARLAPENPGPRPEIETAVLRAAGEIEPERLDRFIAAYADRLWRLKGFVVCRGGSLSVQSSFGNTRILPAPDYSGPSELIALGPGFDARALRLDFERLFRPERP